MGLTRSVGRVGLLDGAGGCTGRGPRRGAARNVIRPDATRVSMTAQEFA